MKNEKLTRKELIDQRLQKAGWDVSDRTRVIEEFFVNTTLNQLNEPDTIYGRAFSDYVLLGKDGNP